MSNFSNKTTNQVDPNTQHVLDLTQNVFKGAHNFVGVIFKDAQGDVVTPSAGTYTIDVLAVNMANYEAIGDGTDIDATLDPASLSFAQNAQNVRYTPTGITGADTVEIGVSSNLG